VTHEHFIGIKEFEPFDFVFIAKLLRLIVDFSGYVWGKQLLLKKT
jgi:hypothetical protein